MENLRQLVLKLRSLVLFRGLLEDPAIQNSWRLRTKRNRAIEKMCGSVFGFCARLFACRVNFSDYILNTLLESENLYALKRDAGKCGAAA